jgi:diguanylate cyclase (GGDEF)-like protein
LCAAVESRLGLLVTEPVATPINGAGTRLPELRAGVLECVAALAQLRAQGVESAWLEAQNALAKTRTELAGARARERQARHRALHDSLTSLPNRVWFRQRLEQSIGRADPGRESLAVMYIDLDGFKAINDTHGHAIGDELLCIVGKRLTRAMRADDAVGRQGGDEFACLLSVVPPCVERLERLARELFDTIAEPFQVGELQLTVRPSIGIAMWPSDGLTAEALVRHADMAMYRAKRERCGHAFYDGHRDAGPPSALAPA